MRQDKLTTKFQQALADAQSLALANDHAYIEPQHLLAAMLDEAPPGGPVRGTRRGVGAGGRGSQLVTSLVERRAQAASRNTTA